MRSTPSTESGSPHPERKATLSWAGVHGFVSLWTSVQAPPDLDSTDALIDELVDSLLAT
jgi:hypothetical protein